MRPTLWLPLLLLAATTLPLLAQGDIIKASPKAVELRRVWMKRGGPHANIGSGFGSVGDINNDGIGDFAYSSYVPWQWQVFLGSTDTSFTTPVWTLADSTGYLRRPLVGDFWGTGRKAVGFLRSSSRDYQYDFLHIFRTEGNHLPDTPALIWQGVANTTPRIVPFVQEYSAGDLDGDGDDELVISLLGTRRGDSNYINGEVWIYAGGPDFQVETPTAILRDHRGNSGRFSAQVADLDGDDAADIITHGRYAGAPVNIDRSYIYFGQPGQLPVSGISPDRELGIGGPVLIDCDGDGITDVINGGVQVFRSGSSKSARTRSYDGTDIDILLRGETTPPRIASMGYLNSRRYAVLGGQVGFQAVAFSGSPTGPDVLWDAWSYGGPGLIASPFQTIEPVMDCTGDGWDDLMAGSIRYPASNSDDGIVMMFAGGPYIPNDDPAVSVRQIPLEGKSKGLSLWPNPVREQLNIAWRGDLRRMPRRFEVYDMLGRLVASGSVPEGDGAAIWECATAVAGTYLFSVLDARDHRLATVRFVKL